MHEEVKEVLFTADRIQARIRELGGAISRDLSGRDPVILALLKGGVVLTADLIRTMDCPVHLDFAWVSSYGGGTVSSGRVELKVFPKEDLSGRTVLVVDDILDTGRTLRAVVDELRETLKASDVRTCVLLDKEVPRAVDVEADYVGFRVGDQFVVGYGLDLDGHYRNLPYIGVLHGPGAGGAGGRPELG